MQRYTLAVLVMTATLSVGCSPEPEVQTSAPPPIELEQITDSPIYQPQVFIELNGRYNTVDGLAVTANGNIVASVPNFNNDYLVKNGVLDAPSPAVMAIINQANEISDWYTFSSSDVHPDTGKVGPMECTFGPDGNLYIADMQVFWDGGHKSRLLRINLKDNAPVDMEVLVEGFIAANGLTWRGDTLFISESILAHNAEPAAGEKKSPLISGVYAFKLAELNGEVIQLKPYTSSDQDPHLAWTFSSSNRAGFGADGLAVDDAGNIYTSVMEDGIVYKTSFDSSNEPLDPAIFAQDANMKSADGIVWDAVRSRLYVADILNNAVHAIDASGQVSTLYQNGDTTGAGGELDQPVVLLVHENRLIIVNMDLAWATPPGLTLNSQVDRPFNLSVIELGSDYPINPPYNPPANVGQESE